MDDVFAAHILTHKPAAARKPRTALWSKAAAYSNARTAKIAGNRASLLAA